MSYDSKRYALVNRLDGRHVVNVRRLVEPEAGARVLEVGCGRGYLTRELAKMGLDVTGIDANPRAVELAVTESVRYMRAEALEFDDQSFDHVIAVHSIEHIPELDGAFSEMARVLKPGGTAFFIYPAEPIKGIWAVPTAIILHNNPFKATQVHCNWLWPKKVRRLVEPHGFSHLHSEFNLLSSPQFLSLFVSS